MTARVGVVVTVALLLSSAPGAQQAGNEEFARRQYESGMSFLQNHRYAEALKDLQAVADSFATSTLADNALLQIAQYQLETARDLPAAQTAIDKLLREHADSDSAPMAHVYSGRLATTKGRAPADVDAAMASYERVARLFPSNDAVAAAGFFAGETLRLVRRPEEALTRYRRVRLEFPRSTWAARAAIGSGYCLVLQDRVSAALQELQWVRQQFPGTPAAAEALNFATLVYRLYVRAPAQPPFGFSGKSIGAERSNYSDVFALAFNPEGQLMLGHKGGVSFFDAQGTNSANINVSEPTAFFIDEKKRIVYARNGSLIADKGESVAINAIERDGKYRSLDNVPAVVSNAKGERLVSDPGEKSVLRFAPDGKYIGVFSATPAARMAVNSLEDIAMLDKGSKLIAVVDRDGKAVGRIPARGTGYELSDPVDVAFDAYDQLYVLDRGRGSVLVFNAKYRYITSATIPERNPGAFTRAAALSIDPAGRLFIFDERAKRIQVYQ